MLKVYVNRKSGFLLILVIVLIQIVTVCSNVSKFHVYGEDRILSRLQSAPLVTYQSQSPGVSVVEQQPRFEPLLPQPVPTAVRPKKRRLKKVTVRPIYNEPEIPSPVPVIEGEVIPESVTTYPEAETIRTTPQQQQKRRRIRQDIGPGQKRRIRKIYKKNKDQLHNEHDSLSYSPAHSILDNYHARDVEIYNRGQIEQYQHQPNGHAIPSPTAWSNSDLQLEESIHPGIFNASSIPISNDFYDPSTSIHGESGLGRGHKLEHLHPLLNTDSLVTQTENHFPENKTIIITHSLSEEVAGEVPVSSDLKFRNKLRKKHPLIHNPDTSLSGEFQVISKNIDPPIIETTTTRQYRKKLSSKIPQRHGTSTVSHSGAVPTTIPTIVTSSISISSSSSQSQSHGPPQPARPTIRLTRRTTTTTTTPTPTITTTLPSTTTPRKTTTSSTTTAKTSTTTTNPTTTTTRKYQDTTTKSSGPKVIVYPLEDQYQQQQIPTRPPSTHAPLTPEEAILSSILSGTNSQQNGQELLNFFNLFTTPTAPPTPAPPPRTTTRRTTTTTTTQKPRPKSTSTPRSTTPNQGEIDNLLQQALLEGILNYGAGTNNNALGSTNTNSLRSAATASTVPNQRPQQNSATTPDLFGLNALLGNLGGAGGNAFTTQQQQFITTPRPFSLFGGFAGLGQQTTARPFSLLGGLFGGGLQTTARPFSFFGGGGQQQPSLFSGLLSGLGQTTARPFSLFGGLGNQQQQPFSLFGGLGNQQQQPSLFGSGSNSLLSLLNPQTTQRPAQKQQVPKKPEVSLADANSLQDLGLAADTKPKSSETNNNNNNDAFDIQSILSSANNNNWPGSNNALAPVTSKPDSSPSETMQLLNILFNRPTGANRPSGPYWWLDMNSFMGGNRNSNNPTEGTRTKIGTREHFLKIQ